MSDSFRLVEDLIPTPMKTRARISRKQTGGVHPIIPADCLRQPLNSNVRARMAKSRDLKGIACGVAESFISRNNDISGYWGIGMLYKEAIEHSVTVIELDLLTGQSLPGAQASQAAVSHYSSYITERLAGLQVLTARITLEFGTFGKVIERWRADSKVKCNTCHRVRSADAKHPAEKISTTPA